MRNLAIAWGIFWALFWLVRTRLEGGPDTPLEKMGTEALLGALAGAAAGALLAVRGGGDSKHLTRETVGYITGMTLGALLLGLGGLAVEQIGAGMGYHLPGVFTITLVLGMLLGAILVTRVMRPRKS